MISKAKRRLMYLVARAYCNFFPSHQYKFSLENGIIFEYPLNSAIGRALFAGSFESYELDFLRRFLKKSDVFIDVGANGGLYTVIAAEKIQNNGHIYACEPSQRELELLEHNIKINSLDNVTIIKSVISSEGGTVKFGIAQDGAMNSLSQTDHPGQKIDHWDNIESTTIDNLIESYQLTKIKLVKIDVEGAEKLVIDGAKELLQSKNSPVILLEASNLNSKSFGFSATQVLQQLVDYGYKIYYFNPEKNGYLDSVDFNDKRVGHQIYNFVASKNSKSIDFSDQILEK